jgi:hypothetical protein
LALPPEVGDVDIENPFEPLLNALPPALEDKESEETHEDPVARLLTDLRANLVESAVSFQAIVVIRSISFTTNWKDQPVTNLVVDVALPLEQPEESDPLDVTA